MMRADQIPDKANLYDFIRQLRSEDRYKGLFGGLF